ncbi:MAG: ribose 5-phosphate isomerase A [Gemmatimonadetes bacterium]|nr:ribose 5-phosphate isomerase A [Gemmatimonadota bacterium]
MKRDTGVRAAALVESGMRLGLGTGSTVAFFLEALASRIAGGSLEDIVGVPTSVRTQKAASRLGIPLGSLGQLEPLDLVVDGADEIDPFLDLIKGLGGALLREKMVAQAGKRFVVIADERKVVPGLGRSAPLPVEVVPFEHEATQRWLAGLGCEPTLRIEPDGSPYVTDNGNLIIHCAFAGGISDARELEAQLQARAGVVESGLFPGLATEAVIAGGDGIRLLTRPSLTRGAGEEEEVA